MAITTPLQMMAEFQLKASDAARQTSQAVRSTLSGIRTDARIGVPVDTGNLRESISYELDTPLSGEVGPEANYGGFVEFGTSRQAPQPFLHPAADRWQPQFEKAVEEVAGFSPVVTRQTRLMR